MENGDDPEKVNAESRNMSVTDWEWIVAWALLHAGLISKRHLRDAPLNLGREFVMRRCSKCGGEYYSDCIPCTFRNGGAIHDEAYHEDDLCDQMTDLVTDRGFKLEIALRWMQVQRTDWD